MALPSLVLGEFNLSDQTTNGSEVVAEGTSRGAPVPLEVAVKSWLQDGAIVVTQGHDNREVAVRVTIRDASLTALAQTEADLFAELGKPNTLTWTPATGPASVFTVITSSMVEAPGTDGDLAEAQSRPWRNYNLRLICEPFVRSVAEVTAAAQAATGTTTTSVDTSSSTTGWAGEVDGVSSSPSVVSGAVSLSSGAVSNPTVSLIRTGSITTSSTKYLVVDWFTSGLPSLTVLTATGDGVTLTRAGQAASPTAGYTRTWYYVAAASVSTLRFDAKFYGGTSVRTFKVDNIDRTDVKPVLGTARQAVRSIDVSGSARTQGSLAVEHATSALGDTIVYVWPDDNSGYVPATRSLYYDVGGGGATTTDGTLVSGARTATTYSADVGMNRLPAGSYVIVARMRSNTGSSTPVDYTVTLGTTPAVTSGGSSTFFAATASSLTVSLTGTTWANVPLGRRVLPPMDFADYSHGLVRVSVGSNAAFQIDEVWLFNTTIGQLTMCSLGTASPTAVGTSNRLFLEPATVLTPRPTLRRGYSSDRSDAYYVADAASWMPPVFKPGITNVFTATSNATDVSTTLRHYPRWHTHAAS